MSFIFPINSKIGLTAWLDQMIPRLRRFLTEATWSSGDLPAVEKGKLLVYRFGSFFRAVDRISSVARSEWLIMDSNLDSNLLLQAINSRKMNEPKVSECRA